MTEETQVVVTNTPVAAEPKFSDYPLRAEILKALEYQGYTTPTPIQAQAIGPAIEGRDIMGLAQTGTGKTAAFALPMINFLATNVGQCRLPGQPRALVLAPTRELAVQIGDSCRGYAGSLPIRGSMILGGVSHSRQAETLDRGVDFVVATPGRLLDVIERRMLTLENVEMLVLDEADRMLDMGFIHDIRRVMSMMPKQRQTLFFSATMSREVNDLAKSLLRNPLHIEVTPTSSTAERVEQSVIMVHTPEKKQVLVDILSKPEATRVIVFTRTKHGADKVERILEKAGFAVGTLHSRKSQIARQKTLRSFGNGQISVLVATDIASRGIDVDDISHVINYELPNEPETYVHRIGRTARAGRAGLAISLCAGDEKAYLKQIERIIKQKVPVAERPESCGYVVPEPAKVPYNDGDSRGGGYGRDRDSGYGRDSNRGGGYAGRGGQNSGYAGRGGAGVPRSAPSPRYEDASSQNANPVAFERTARENMQSQDRDFAPARPHNNERAGFVRVGLGNQSQSYGERQESSAPRGERRYDNARPAAPRGEPRRYEGRSENRSDSRGDRPASPYAARAYGAKSADSRSDRPAGERGFGNKNGSERPAAGKSYGRPSSGSKSGGRGFGAKAAPRRASGW